jgi:hypothetical protein
MAAKRFCTAYFNAFFTANAAAAKLYKLLLKALTLWIVTPGAA